jgi:cephalosporin hydroxylase
MADVTGTGDGMVQIAYLHNEHVSHSWHISKEVLRDYDLDRAVVDGADLAHAVTTGYRIARRPLNLRCGSGIVAHVRNYAARLFLDKTPHEWLLFIDTDMGFQANAVHRLLEAADPVQRPVVGALCFAAMEAAYDGMGGWRRTIVPTMYKLGKTNDDDADPSFCYFGDYDDDTVTPVAGTGGAFLLIHRSALEKLRAEHGNHWFDMMYDRADDIVGEDIAFCGRLLKAGIIPHVHTGVKTTHHKEVWLSELDYVMQNAVTLQPYPDLVVAIDIEESFEALAAGEHAHDGMWKLPADLDRYAQVIEATRPEVLVETGTHTGGSARWFADHDLDVITVDVDDPFEKFGGEAYVKAGHPRITLVRGSSVDPDVVARVSALVAGRRCMVSLDSDHSAAHVAREIEAYGPLVSPGCYLVVEDTLFGYGHDVRSKDHGLHPRAGSPLDAVARFLAGKPDWSRDVAIERSATISQNPAGWWVRGG